MKYEITEQAGKYWVRRWIIGMPFYYEMHWGDPGWMPFPYWRGHPSTLEKCQEMVAWFEKQDEERKRFYSAKENVVSEKPHRIP